MAQTTSGLRAVFSTPWVYDAFQNAMGASRGRRELVREFIRPAPGCRILDIGCGTADILRYLPGDVRYWGYDISDDYISSARARFGARGHFERGTVTGEVVSGLPPMDVVLAIGVLHHLDDREAAAMLALARGSLAADGRMITIDPAFAGDQNFLARYLVSIDRGQNVRDAEGYRGLAGAVFPQVRGTLRHRAWIPYTHWIMECST